MARPKSTFGKLQRERDKQAKARAKQEDRAARREEKATTPKPEVAPSGDQTALLEELARLHEDYANKLISPADFETKLEELKSRISVY